VLLGRRDGTFAQEARYAVGRFPYSLQNKPADVATAQPADLAKSIVLSNAPESSRGAFLALGGRLERLPGTARECALIAEVFTKSGGTPEMLLGVEASETAVKQKVRGQGYVHLAAHGLVDERYDNLFGALALTPPSSGEEGSDGFLAYNEILELPLQDCDLAALSACKTNVGPERPLETASSLAQAFLAAGARRVVASHWSVADQSTADLMASFFGNIVANPQSPSIDYAAALRNARLQVKRESASSEPYFWAPFVLIGPPTSKR